MNSNTKETKHTAPEKHVRRKHYAGRYPKNFEEKYKELNPEKYQDIATHVKANSCKSNRVRPVLTQHWDTEATPAPCWNSYKAKDTCMQQM